METGYQVQHKLLEPKWLRRTNLGEYRLHYKPTVFSRKTLFALGLWNSPEWIVDEVWGVTYRDCVDWFDDEDIAMEFLASIHKNG